MAGKRVLFLICVCICGALLGADFEKNFSGAARLFEKGNFSAAAARLDKLLSDKNLSAEERGRAALLLSRVYLADGKGILALKVLEGVDSGRPEEFYVVLGEALLACGKNDEASRVFSYYDASRSPRLFYPALLVGAKAQLAAKSYLGCIASCRRIIAEVPKLYGYSGDDEMKKLVSDTRELLMKALELYETERYGLDYVNYRKGREAEEAGALPDAIEHYAKIKSGTLKDAGRCYTGHCLARLGRAKEALKIYEELIEEDFSGFYRGEALYETAVLQYLDGDADKAFKTASRLNEWLSAVSGRKKELSGVNENLKSEVIATSPTACISHDDCGNLIRTKFYAGSINNRETAPWYLSLLRTRAHLLYSFLLGERGELKKAAEIFRQAGEDAGGAIRTLSDDGTIPGLVSALESGAYLIPAESLKKLSSKFRNPINLACFYAMSEERERALRLFESLEKSREMNGKSNETAAVLYGIACCRARAGEREDALKILETLSEDPKYRSNPLSANALYMRGCLLSSGAGTVKKAYECFERVAGGGTGGELPARALLAGAVCAVNAKDKAKAKKFCEELLAKHAKTSFAPSARTLLASLEAAKENEILGLVRGDGGGRTLNHKVTIIYPGTSDWSLGREQIGEGDIVFYKIKCIPRDGCSIVRSFQMDLTPAEPAVPSSKGDQLVFLRVPALFMRNF